MTSERHALILAPFGSDAARLADMCARVGIAAETCASPVELGRRAVGGFLLALITEEACSRETEAALMPIYEDTPPWSWPPVVALVDDPDRPPAALRRLRAAAPETSFVILRRPASSGEIHSALVAARAFRARQYDLRDMLSQLTESNEREQFLRKELDHRVRNNLAHLSAVLSMTAGRRSGESQVVRDLQARIGALANLHDLLGPQSLAAIPLSDLIRESLAPVCQDRSVLTLEGPDLVIHQGMQMLSMAFNELGMNAAKYGALSRDGGTIAICWGLMEDAAFELTWDEHGGPPVAGPPDGDGFGTQVLTRLVPATLNARVDLDYARTGVRFRLQAPLPDGDDAVGLDVRRA